MNLKNKLRVLGCAGIFALAGCVSAPVPVEIPKTFPEQYGNLLLLRGYENQIGVYYDTDNDQKADLLLIYNVNGQGEDGTLYLELSAIAEDKNKDGNFTEDELVPYEPGTKIQVKNLI